jgi:hypothetical protein
MSVQPRGRPLTVLEAERLEGHGTGQYRRLAAHGIFGTASAIDRV